MPSSELPASPSQNDATRRPEPYGGRYRDVLEHPDHKAGVEDGTIEVLSLAPLAPSVTRVTALLQHGMPPAAWTVTNPAIRLHVPDGAEYVSRVYTVRDVVAHGEDLHVVIDVIVHDGDSPMMRLLAGLRVGDLVPVLGPRPHFTPAFRAGRPVLLFADETAIPALATILRDWPSDTTGEAWIETPDRAVVDDVPTPSGVTVHAILRDPSTAPGTTGALPEAARTITGESTPPIVWASGEAGEIAKIRRYFRTDLGLPKEDVSAFVYWRRSVSSSEIDRRRVEYLQKALHAGRNIQEITVEELEG